MGAADEGMADQSRGRCRAPAASSHGQAKKSSAWRTPRQSENRHIAARTRFIMYRRYAARTVQLPWPSVLCKGISGGQRVKLLLDPLMDVVAGRGFESLTFRL